MPEAWLRFLQHGYGYSANMQKTLIYGAILLCLPLQAQKWEPRQKAAPMPVSTETRAVVQKIIGDTLVNGQAYEYDRQLADEIGSRLTGSANYLKAVAWGEQKFKELGLTNVHTESFKVDTWEPEPGATGQMISPVNHALHLWSYGWSPSTPTKGVEGEVVYLPSFTEEGISKMRDQVQGKIVFFDIHSLPQPMVMAKYFRAANALAAMGPTALLVRGGTNGTESMGYLIPGGKLLGFPVAQIGAEDGLLLKRLLDRGPVRIGLQFSNRCSKAVDVPQVVGEIRGSETPDEVVILGAHLDSWNPGTGAQDNGTGVATVIDAAREMQSLGRPPRRTVRFILFGGEEEGKVGSVAYAKQHRTEMDKIDAVLITDTGAEPAKGWLLMGRTDEQEALAQVEPLLSGLGSGGTSDESMVLLETDHIGFDVLGVPTLVLWTDLTKYTALHHKASDTFDSVDKATLLQGDATVIATTYAIADAATAFAHHLDAKEVNEMMKPTNRFEDFEYYKEHGLLP
jgi:carboxypeptidase Q